ncbi:hypothetical protein TSAR_000296, partial [Trichomalopsis sarcophagae]
MAQLSLAEYTFARARKIRLHESQSLQKKSISRSLKVVHANALVDYIGQSAPGGQAFVWGWSVTEEEVDSLRQAENRTEKSEEEKVAASVGAKGYGSGNDDDAR